MSYDEQRISDQIDGGLHQQKQQETTTKETMTKEQMYFKRWDTGKPMGRDAYLELMEEYAQQQLSAELERSKKLVQCAESLLFLHGCEQEGLSSGKPSFADWIHATNNLQNEIDRFKSTDPETTGNQEVTNPST